MPTHAVTRQTAIATLVALSIAACGATSTDSSSASQARTSLTPAPRATPGAVTAIDGVYTLHTTEDDLRAAGAPEGDISCCRGVIENYGDFTTVLNRGVFTQAQPGGCKGAGTYTVMGDTFTMTFTEGSGCPIPNRPGEVFTYQWSLYRDQLTLKAVPGEVSPEPLLAKPWRRTGNAP